MLKSSCSKCRLSLVAAVGVILVSGLAQADVRLIPDTRYKGQSSFQMSDFAHLKIFGEIEAADVEVAKRLLPQAIQQSGIFASADHKQRVPVIIFDSPGGNLAAATAIGRLLRKSAAKTTVARDGQCASACVFAFLGGVTRFAGGLNSVFGLHRPYFEQKYFSGLSLDESRRKYDQLVAASEEYLKEMGARSGLMDEMLVVPSQSIVWLTDSEAGHWGIVGDDPAYSEWKRARDIEANGKDWVEYLDCLMVAKNRSLSNAQTVSACGMNPSP